MPYIGKKPADIIATAVDTTTGTFSGEVDAGSLDVSGNADIDGITNLDNTDIDGTLDVSGDLTVDTNTLYVDSANNRVGIGTTSPNNLLALENGDFQIHETGSSDPLITLSVGNTQASPTQSWGFRIDNSDSDKFQIRDFTGANTIITADTSGNLGIGTASPAKTLHIATTGLATPYLHFTTDGTGHTASDGASVYLDRGTDGLNLSAYETNGTIVFRTNGATEAMRIDSSQNLLVGTTDSTPYNNSANSTSDNGIALGGTGIVSIAKFNDNPLIVNRTGTNDGAIIKINKSGSEVGSIGVLSSRIYIGNTDTALFFNDSSNAVTPYNVTLATQSNGVIDLGTGTTRWKDIFLSSGISIKGSDPKITLEHSNENGTAKIYTTAQSAIVLDADPDNTDNGTPIIFNIDGDEVGRFDDSKFLLVGTTDSSPENNSAGTTDDNGVALSSNGYGSFARYAANSGTGIPFFLNRTNADGGLVQFRKDGSTVGSIGVNGTRLHIASTGNSGLRFRDDLNAIIPCNSDGSNSDGDQNLGVATVRFKTLFLSEGVRLGGTATANELDSYEEGTFEVTLAPTGGGSFTLTSSANTLAYTKIGRQVTITGQIIVDSESSPVGDVKITGLPFTVANLTDESGDYSGTVNFFDASASTQTLLATRGFESTTELNFRQASSGVDAGDKYWITFTYFT